VSRRVTTPRLREVSTSKKHIFRVLATAAVIIVPAFLAGCVSSDRKAASKGFAAIEAGQLAEAESVLTEAVQVNPNNPYAFLNLGTVYQRTGRSDQAREIFERVVALDPNEKPSKRSKFVDESKTLKQIAEDNLKTLPAKK
jgi:Flp pilus assembly protein TadD